MNERLKELAEQADDYTDNKIQMQGEYHPDWHDIRDQKFAELIVSEFIKEPVAWTRTDVPAPIIHEEVMQKHPELRQYFPVPLYYGPQE